MEWSWFGFHVIFVTGKEWVLDSLPVVVWGGCNDVVCVTLFRILLCIDILNIDQCLNDKFEGLKMRSVMV